MPVLFLLLLCKSKIIPKFKKNSNRMDPTLPVLDKIIIPLGAFAGWLLYGVQ